MSLVRRTSSPTDLFTWVLAQELCSTGIKINAVCPGWVRTEMSDPAAPTSVADGTDTTRWGFSCTM